MNVETRVGLFVLLGLIVSGVGVMKLSDFSLEKRITLHFIFEDVGNLRDKSVVRVSGVEVGQVSAIGLEDGKAKVSAKINKSLPVYANGRVKVKLTGIIGTQFLDLDPGTPEAPRLKDGDILYGQPTRTINELMEKLGDLVEGRDGKSGIATDLKATMANLRSITDSLNEAIGRQRDELKDIVLNLHQFSIDLKGLAGDLHGLTSARKADIDASLVRLRSILERVDELVARVQSGEGPVGKLIADREMGEDVKRTVSNLRETSASAKEVLNRFVKVRAFWEAQLRVVPGAGEARGDGGVRLQPRDGKYYYVGINNAGDGKDESKRIGDYEKENTITAVLGKDFGPASFEVGAIRSKPGVGMRYAPFRDAIAEARPSAWLRNVELNAQLFDFTRDETRGRAGEERAFRGPQFDIGARYRILRWLDVGATLEDVVQFRQYNVATHVRFEDKDLSYLFGFVSFAR